MNKSILKILVGFTALSLASCAAFFSIIGLAKLFAGAKIAIIIMASILESSKLVIASFLYQYRNISLRALKIYLSIALVIIMSITSIGIYGFLSSAFQNTKLTYELSSVQSNSLSDKINVYESNIELIRNDINNKSSQLNNLIQIRNLQEQQVLQSLQNTATVKSNTNFKSTDASIRTLNLNLDSLNKVLTGYNDSLVSIKMQSTQSSLSNQLSSELGPLVFIANILNISIDKIVNWLIILFIIVFDPLAICMTLVYNFLNESSAKNNKEISNIQPIKLESETGQISSNDSLIEMNSDNKESNVISNDMNLNNQVKNKKYSSEYSGAVNV
jgi:hypothetical protein